MTGGPMTVGRDALIAAEDTRVTSAFQAAGSFGLSAAEKIEYPANCAASVVKCWRDENNRYAAMKATS